MIIIRINRAPAGSPYSRGDVVAEANVEKALRWVKEGSATIVEETSNTSLRDIPVKDEAGLSALSKVLTPKQIEALEAAGFATVDSVLAASEDELTAVKGIGAKTVSELSTLRG